MQTLNVNRTATGLALSDPVVIEPVDAETAATRSLATHVVVDGDVLRYNTGDQQLEMALAPENAVSIQPDGLMMTVQDSTGGSYQIHRVTDDDGTWASGTGGPAPADSLEQLALGAPYMSTTPFAETTENLWAAVDPDTEQLQELVYSSPTGDYVRSSQGWFKMPDDDESLDGLESIDVTGDFVNAFDVAEQNQEPLTRDQVLEYQADDSADSADAEPGAEDSGDEPDAESDPTADPEVTR